MGRLLFAVLILIFIAGKPDVSESRGTRANYCTRLVSYVEDVVVPETERVKETYTAFCWSSITLKCTKHRYNTITVNKTVHVYKTKHVLDCCPGYKKEKDVCIPICNLGCNHGECVEPDICLCEPGWKEPLCETQCEPNRFGRGCKGNCTCFHGAQCNQETGFCHCTEGYSGDQCQFPCPINTYGQDCKFKCECKNDGVCDIVDGTCYCRPGYKGEFCEEPCDYGTHGQDCGKECICIPENTESCHHVDGKCACKPGYGGEFCEKECDDFTYGLNCSKKCSCFHSEFCDHINGKCYCKPGWKGAECSEMCGFGTYGENCSFECTRCLNVSGYCDRVTGYCNCPPGRYGDFCDIACSPGYWGSNCSNICTCIPGESCDPEDGTCSSSNGENNSNESSSYTVTKLFPDYMVLVLGIVAFLILLLFLFTFCRVYIKGDLEFPMCTPFHVLHVFRRRRLNEKKCPMPGSTHDNPVYEFNEVQLETEKNGKGFIRGSFSSGVKYIRNNMNNLDEENKPSNVEKTEDGTEDLKQNRNSSKSSSIRKTFVLSGVFKEMKRGSLRKTDSVHSSTDELENDFQPEILEDFNVMENIYDKPKEKIIENIYEKPTEKIIENVYEKPTEKITENVYEKPTENITENIYEKPVVIDYKNLSLKE